MLKQLFNRYQNTQKKRKTNTIDQSKFKPRTPYRKKRKISTDLESIEQQTSIKEMIQNTKMEKFEILNSKQIMIHPLYNINRILNSYKPNFVIMYDPDIGFIRNLEVYKAENPEIPLRVYFCIYENSVEEQIYLQSLKQEQENFKQLIQLKSKLSIPTIETLLSQLKKEEGKNQVIVDVREFRSALPSLLNANGIRVIPINLIVGDYIITKDICIERKSISDLQQSLKLGRLFTQTANMLKYYKTGSLLIQFESQDEFCLVPINEYTDKVKGYLLSSKLALLTIHFPRLKIFWSRSPEHSIELFKILKKGKEEPDPISAQSTGSIEQDTNIADTDNAIELLKRLPGITESNIQNIIDNIENLYELSQLSYTQLSKLIGKQNAVQLYDFFNQDFFKGK